MGSLSELHEEILCRIEGRDDPDLLGKHLDDNESRITVGRRDSSVATLVVSAHLEKWWIDTAGTEPVRRDLRFTFTGYRFEPGGDAADASRGPRRTRVGDAAAHLVDRLVAALDG